MLLKLYCALELSGGLVDIDCDEVVSEWGLAFCVRDKLCSGAAAAGSRATFQAARV